MALRRSVAAICQRKFKRRAIVSGLAALFLDQMNAFDANAALDRLDHVVDRQARNRYRRQRLHLDAGRAGDLYGGADDAARQLLVRGDVERDFRQSPADDTAVSDPRCAWPP